MQLRTVIVDDEVSAREILENLLTRFFPSLEIVGMFANVPEAVDGIKRLRPDVVFLDVEMPEYAGYEIVDFFDDITFKIIFVTAYDQYAIKAFEVSAIDYLLKPIEIDRLRDAVSKLEDSKELESSRGKLMELANDLRQSEQKIAYFDKGYRCFIQVKDIVALEAQRSYTEVHLLDGNRLVVSKNLKQLEEELSTYSVFYRTHRSWIINLDYFVKYSKTRLEISLENDTTAKLSKQIKPDFELKLVKM